MVNLETICEDIARITSNNVYPWGVRLTVNLERIHNDLEGLHMKTPYNHEISVLPHIMCKAPVGN